MQLDLAIFVTFDLGALVIQSIGGAKASSAAKNGTNADDGGRIMLYGIIVQMSKSIHFLSFSKVNQTSSRSNSLRFSGKRVHFTPSFRQTCAKGHSIKRYQLGCSQREEARPCSR